jgi:cell division inhibitor SepF
MPGFFNKAMDYLGLSDNEPYGEYEPYEDQAPPAPTRRAPERSTYDFEQPTVRAVPVIPVDSGIGTVTAQPRPGGASPSTGAPSGSGSVRPLPGNTANKPHAVTPTSFADAQEIGERFRAAQPVIVNLGEVDRELKRRLIDFAAGLTFALNGTMDRVSDVVYMLTPRDVTPPPMPVDSRRPVGV